MFVQENENLTAQKDLGLVFSDAGHKKIFNVSINPA